MITRREFLYSATVAAALQQAERPKGVGAPGKSRPPNILYITSDQQRFDELACDGNSIVRTPNLDRLAREGIRFERAFTQSPVCTPSRVSMFTGRYPHTHRVRYNPTPIPPGETTLAMILKQHGYATRATGKLDPAPADPGFDEHVPATPRLSAGRSLVAETDRVTMSAVFVGDEEKHWDMHILRTAQRMLRADPSRPRFVHVSFQQPHRPTTPIERFARRYKPADMPLPVSFAKGFGGRPPSFQAVCRKLGWDRLTRAEVQTINARRLACAEMLDSFVGELRKTLEETGQAENTIVVYQSDHGDYAGEFGLINKAPASLVDGLLRVPLILWAPGRIQPRTEMAMVEEIDILPTLLELCALAPPAGVQGRSLTGSPARGAVFAEITWGAAARMVRTDAWKLIFSQSGEHELYDLREDPGETRNLYGARPKVERELLERLLLWTVETQDQLPLQMKPGNNG